MVGEIDYIWTGANFWDKYVHCLDFVMISWGYSYDKTSIIWFEHLQTIECDITSTKLFLYKNRETYDIIIKKKYRLLVKKTLKPSVLGERKCQVFCPSKLLAFVVVLLVFSFYVMSNRVV